MIDKREILDSASRVSLTPHVVEKDYVLGWILAGIYAHPELSDSWLFKGGTCLKKCFFETSPKISISRCGTPHISTRRF
jgi:predicted nucleotidyltransferase component of viral defense system